MVKLPYYDNGNLTISDGSSTFRTVNTGADRIGAAVSKFGETLGSASVQKASLDARTAGLAEREAKRISGLEDANQYQQFVQGWLPVQQQLKDAASPTGKDFTDTTIQKFDEYAATFTSKLDPERRAEWENKIQRVRTEVLSSSIGFESSRRNEFIKGYHKDTLEEFGNKALAAGKEAQGLLTQEAVERIKSLKLGNEKLEEAFIGEASRAIARGALLNEAQRNPRAIIDAATGIAATMPTTQAPPRVQQFIKKSNEAGLGPTLLPAIGIIESNLNPDVVPRFKDGRKMSSAQGEMQILDGAYGIKDKFDPDEVGGKLGQFLAQQKERLEAQGITPTPGKLYAMHNLGPGAAMSLITANPSEPVASVMARLYGNKGFNDKNTGTYRLWREAVIENNPSLYGNGSISAGEALQKLEAKMANATKQVSKYVSDGAMSSDEIVKGAAAKLGLDSKYLTASDFNDAVKSAASAAAKQEKEMYEFNAGRALLTGETRMDPNDETHKKLVNRVSEVVGYGKGETSLKDGLLQGDADAFSAARNLVSKTNFIPAPIASALEQVILSQATGDQPRQAQALETLRSVRNDNPLAWASSSINSEVKKRVEDYVAAVDIGKVQPADAIRDMSRRFSPEGEATAKAMKGWFGTPDGKAELGQRTAEEFLTKLGSADGRFLRLGVGDGDMKSAAVAGMHAAYLEGYQRHREAGMSEKQAIDRAVSDLKGTYGATDVFASTAPGWLPRSTVMKHPVERNYPPIGNSYQWVEQQARETLSAELKLRGVKNYDPKTGMTGADAAIVGFVPLGSPLQTWLVPDAQTDQEKRTGKPVTYKIGFINPRTGLPDITYERFVPDFKRAMDENDATFTRNRAARESDDAKAMTSLIEQTP